MSSTRTYRVWWDMQQRCRNPNVRNFKNYGGRGIYVCERWKRFENFLADMGHKPAGKSLDRINNDGNYEPGNCRWATYRQQLANTRRALRFTRNGVTKCLTEWAEEFGLVPGTVLARVRKGWSIEAALNTQPLPINQITATYRWRSK